MMFTTMSTRPVLVILVVAGFCGVMFSDAQTGSCQDKALCKLYSRDICTSPTFYTWAQSNCQHYCGFCIPTAHSQVGVGKLLDEDGSNNHCKDAIANCASYGMAICKDVNFFSWVNENCRAHCSRCNDRCVDKVPNCAEYGDTLCTELSYYNWVEINCRKSCSRCHT